jgi:transcriptional regulator with XRE-family HTH domain
LQSPGRSIDFPIGKRGEAMDVRSTADLGTAIRIRRIAKGYRLADLAGLAGVSVRFLSELENGRGSVGLDRALAIADLVGLRLTVSDETGLLDDVDRRIAALGPGLAGDPGVIRTVLQRRARAAANAFPQSDATMPDEPTPALPRRTRRRRRPAQQ